MSRAKSVSIQRLRCAGRGLLGLCCLLMAGCAPIASAFDPSPGPGEVGNDDHEHFVEAATNVEFDTGEKPELRAGEAHPPEEDSLPVAPRPLFEIPESEVWRMTLLEAINYALNLNSVVLADSQFLATGNLLFANPESIASVYDPALQKAATRGTRSSAAAESDFIPTLSAQLKSSDDEKVQNNLFSGGLTPGQVLDQQFTNFELKYAKQLRTGGEVALKHDVNFDRNNVPSRLFRSVYNGTLSLDVNQPLLGGAGFDFTDIAGPVGFISQRYPSVDQGIHVARINEELSQVEFELALRRLVKDVTDVYWDLAFAHREYEIQERYRKEAERVWNRAKAKLVSGVGDGAAAEAQAAESYYAARAQTEDALATVALTEIRFRRLLGLAANDHQIIRPFDDPTTAPMTGDWLDILFTAYCNRYELRQTKLTAHSLELQLAAAERYAKPRLDFVGNLHTNGFGNQLFQSTPQSMLRPDSFYNSLGQFTQTGWSAGLVFTMPVDRRIQRTLIRQLELKLAKARSTLSAQEWEVSRELTHAFKTAEKWYQLVQTNTERVEAARRQVRVLEAAFPSGKVTTDLLVRSQRTLAAAETEQMRSIVEYNKAQADLKYRQGTLLDESKVIVMGRAAPEEVAPK